MWVLPQLPAGNYTQIEVQYECVKAAVKAGNTVSVSSSEGAQAQDTAYLEIRPASGGADVRGLNARQHCARGHCAWRGKSGGTALARKPGGTSWRGTPGGTPWSARTKTDENQAGENRPGNTAPKTTQPSGPLTMTVAALHNPVAVGKELTYEIRVVNNTGAADHEVTVTAIVPDGMIPSAAWAPPDRARPSPTSIVKPLALIR